VRAWSAAKAPARSGINTADIPTLEATVALSALDDRITLKYGAGGQAMRSLIQQVFLDGMTRECPVSQGILLGRGHLSLEPSEGLLCPMIIYSLLRESQRGFGNATC
jgi:hypothetical protein